MDSPHLVLIYFIIEKHFEKNTLMLAKSIRHFSDQNHNYQLLAINPRLSRLSIGIESELKRLDVHLESVNLNRFLHFYPLSNKVFASSYVEAKYGNQYDVIMFLDSDTLVLKPLDELFRSCFKIAVKPESDNIIGLGVDQDPNIFWVMLYEQANLKLSQAWSVTTTIDNQEIKAYYNSGVLVTKKSGEVFQTWKDCFLKTITDRRSFKLDYLHYYFIEQATLSMAIVKNLNQSDVLPLENNFNFPLHLYKKSTTTYDFSKIAILHYHKLLTSSSWMHNFTIQPEVLQWILTNRPHKNDRLGIKNRFTNILKFQIFKMRYKYHVLPQSSL